VQTYIVTGSVIGCHLGFIGHCLLVTGLLNLGGFRSTQDIG